MHEDDSSSSHSDTEDTSPPGILSTETTIQLINALPDVKIRLLLKNKFIADKLKIKELNNTIEKLSKQLEKVQNTQSSSPKTPDKNLVGANIQKISHREVQFKTPEQIALLKKRYEVSSYISREEASALAEETKLTRKQVQMWFSDERRKCKNSVTSQFSQPGTASLLSTLEDFTKSLVCDEKSEIKSEI